MGIEVKPLYSEWHVESLAQFRLVGEEARAAGDERLEALADLLVRLMTGESLSPSELEAIRNEMTQSLEPRDHWTIEEVLKGASHGR